MFLDGAWSDLETKGYLVGRRWLSESDLSELCAQYEKGPRPDGYFLGLKPLGRSARAYLSGPIASVLAEVRAHTTLRVDATLKGYYFATEFVNYSWHQDFEVLAQDLDNYLNLYVPITKPRLDKTNLTLVPFDSLADVAPDAHGELRYGFGNVFELIDADRRQYRVTNLCSNSERTVEVALEDAAVTPELNAGDLLMLRADVIHRTQDSETNRLAVSIRAVNSAATIRRDVLAGCGGLVKQQRREADMLLRCFEEKGRDQITMADFLDYQEAASVRTTLASAGAVGEE